MSTLFFLFIWLCIVPFAVLRISTDITEEEIFQRPLAYLDARFRGTLLAKFFRCHLCFSHWVTFLFALGFWKSFIKLPVPAGSLLLTAVVLIFAVIEEVRLLKGKA